MTEPVSISTVGIAGILTCILARLRVSLWWGSLHLPMSSAIQLSIRSPEDLQILRSMVEDILNQFNEAKNLSLKYHMPTSISPSTDLAVCDPDRNLVLRRQRELGLSGKVTWAFYNWKSYNRLIEKVTDLVNGLVILFPSEEFHLAQQQLCWEEVEELELEHQPDLHVQQETSCEGDNMLGETFRRAISTRDRNWYERMTVTGHAMVENGDYVAQGSVATGSRNLYSRIHISGITRVRNGTNYGGRGVFD
ncbi:hypothetical protein BJX63DRAFT_414798 [Aspergillus granulosus]|uniref:Prion-inhibition and propagation HeLo domain-containing protein n=1 Tax=Aspergillus granulosus TaxID=176169 RepID=A0ABR4GTY5_9EURO